MPSEKEKTVLKSSEYKINGNVLRAFYDKHDKLVFVLDYTTSDIKPNVLLVMSSYGDRKWDDVLSNDYAVDLETVRPKKDNKYQKLDVEYDGLVVYDNLIRAYTDDGNVKKALRDLDEFRAAAAYRSASERKDVANAIAENARETIERTNDTIIELQSKIKALRTKLANLRRGIGREPTKQSAAKILKAEAQMDVLTGKLERAKKRLENANKRLVAAEEDVAAAQSVLDLLDDVDTDVKFKTVETKTKVAPVVKQDTSEEDDTDDENYDEEYDADFEDDADTWTDDDENDDDDGDEKSADNEVKPLFDKDPNILDENIAFKPISFDETPVDEPVEPVVADDKDTPTQPAVSFEPPKPIMDVVRVPDEYESDADVKLDGVFSESINDDVKYDAPDITTDATPMLDSLKNVEELQKDTDKQEEPLTEPDDADTVPVLETVNRDNEIVAPAQTDVSGLVNVNNDAPRPDDNDIVSAIKPVPSTNVARPVSPINKTPIVTNVQSGANTQRRPNLLYYVLLLVLIGLSVFTLWMYQRSNAPVGTIPELISDNSPVTVVETKQDDVVVNDMADAEVDEDESPFVADGDTEATTGVSTVQDVVAESLDKIANAADIDMASTSDNTTNTESNTDDNSGVSGDDVAPDTNSAATVDKPEYKVSHENVFVNKETGLMENDLCEGNVAPDANGCCPGETYSSVDNQMVCCPDGGGDCFPPLF